MKLGKNPDRGTGRVGKREAKAARIQQAYRGEKTSQEGKTKPEKRDGATPCTLEVGIVAVWTPLGGLIKAIKIAKRRKGRSKLISTPKKGEKRRIRLGAWRLGKGGPPQGGRKRELKTGTKGIRRAPLGEASGSDG